MKNKWILLFKNKYTQNIDKRFKMKKMLRKESSWPLIDKKKKAKLHFFVPLLFR